MRPSTILAWLLYWLIVLWAVILISGCTTTIRLGQGECVVLDDRNSVIVAGHGCNVQRIYR